MAKKVFIVPEMDCADCAINLENMLKKNKGITNVKPNFATAELTIIYDESVHDEKSLTRLLKQLGYSGTTRTEKLPHKEVWWHRKTILFRAISGTITAIGLVTQFLGASSQIYIPIYIVAIVIGLYYPAISGFKSLLKFRLSLNILLVLATAGAIALNLWAEAAGLIFVFSLGEVLEAYAVSRTRKSIQELIELSPKTALVKRDNEELTLPVEQVKVDDVIIIKPGEKVALDGDVINGETSINEAAITGESIPANKAGGDNVFAGTINQQGSIEVKVSRLSSDTTLAKIIHSVEEAQLEKAESQRFSENFGRYYTPVIFFLAVFVAVVPALAFNQPARPWIERALVLLVVSCPCALVLSTPVTVVTAIGAAARNGVLVKGGIFLEELARTKVFVFDKTGTLTKGQPEVTDIINFGSYSEEQVLQFALAVEARSEHPLAEAILKKGKHKKLSIEQAQSFEAITGKGAKAYIDGREEIIVGSQRLFETKLSPENSQTISKLQNEGKTIVYVGKRTEFYGAIAVADQIREASKETIIALRKAGIEKIIMLTGDNEQTAGAIAKQTGLDSFEAQLLPEEKVRAIRDLKDKYGKVAMVGDGVNDAPALALSSVGIAMGVAGTDIALETADMALMSDDLLKTSYAYKKSKKTLRIIKQNTAISLSIIALLVIFALSGFLGLVPGILANEGSSLLIVANGLRLLR